MEKKTQMSPLQTVWLFAEANLSRNQHENLRRYTKYVYLCYGPLQKAKIDCYPNPDKKCFKITETVAVNKINIQDLLHWTVTRLFMYLYEVLEILHEERCA